MSFDVIGHLCLSDPGNSSRTVTRKTRKNVCKGVFVILHRDEVVMVICFGFHHQGDLAMLLKKKKHSQPKIIYTTFCAQI